LAYLISVVDALFERTMFQTVILAGKCS